jgi:tellurite resistance protein TerC
VIAANIHQAPTWLWVLFLAFVTGLILIDAHTITLKEAFISTLGWIAVSVAFGVLVWAVLGHQAGTEYFTGYVIEKALSVDNVFVWAVIFSYFRVPSQYQHRVLFWGIFGALVLRAAFVFAGTALIEKFDWMMFVFGGFLIITALRVAFHEEEEIHPEHNPLLKAVRKILPVSKDYDGQKMLTHVDGKLAVTPLMVVLILIESTDILFAVDSVPAILAVSQDRFVVLSSNAFAILGLRSMYFLLEGSRERLVHLNKGLGAILLFVGVKMVLSRVYEISTPISLAVIAVLLGITVFVSLRATEPETGP